MRDWNNDGFPDPVPDNWRDYTSGTGCFGCAVWLVVIVAAIYIVLNA